MANSKLARIARLEEVHIEVKRAAVVTFTGLGEEQDYTAPSARFTIGNESDLTYDEVLARGYEVMTFMPEKDNTK